MAYWPHPSGKKTEADMTKPAHWFTRATIHRPAPDVAPLINTLLNPNDKGRCLNTTHRLLWTLMPESIQGIKEHEPKRTDRATFLWRAAPDYQGNPSWYLLGPKPRENSAFFSVETKPWSPSFVAGDRLAFDISVNATVNRLVDPAKGRDGRLRVDVVMDAIQMAERSGRLDLPRAILRRTFTDEALRFWWDKQGSHSGFLTSAMNVVNYRNVQLEGRRSARLGIGHLTGVLEVTDPEAFESRVRQGFGRAKAFGCGLLLLRRA
jgi:CRISPR system Cascade subunit CasE